MRPVHVPPHRPLWVVLVEHVITTSKKNGTVRIVHPIVRGQQMVLGTKRVRGKLAAQGRAVRIENLRGGPPLANQDGGAGELQKPSTRNGHGSACAGARLTSYHMVRLPTLDIMRKRRTILIPTISNHCAPTPLQARFC